MLLATIDGNVTCVWHLLLGGHYSHLSYYDNICNCTMTCESIGIIDIIILLLELLILDI